MTKKNIRYSGDAEAELGKLLRSVAHRHHLWDVFRDFVAMLALAMSNAVDKRNFEAREREYLQIVKRYNSEEVHALAGGLQYIEIGLTEGHQDFLGALFMRLELGNKYRGQFFTPYEVSRLMAELALPKEDMQRTIDRKGCITVSDPCVGGGGMLIAYADRMKDAGFHYQKQMHAVAVDIDITAVHMSYIQLSLLGIPALIYHGNSLTMAIQSEWRTVMHQLGRWDAKLAADDEQTTTQEIAVNADAFWPRVAQRARRAA